MWELLSLDCVGQNLISEASLFLPSGSSFPRRLHARDGLPEGPHDNPPRHLCLRIERAQCLGVRRPVSKACPPVPNVADVAGRVGPLGELARCGWRSRSRRSTSPWRAHVDLAGHGAMQASDVAVEAVVGDDAERASLRSRRVPCALETRSSPGRCGASGNVYAAQSACCTGAG
jgi:hypothetical protein